MPDKKFQQIYVSRSKISIIKERDNTVMENQTLPEEQSTAEMITEYASLLWRWTWLLVLVAVLAGGTAYWVSRRQTPIYEASTLVMVDIAPITQTVTYTTLTTSEQLVATYSKLMTTAPLLDVVAARLGIPAFPEPGSIEPNSIQVEPILNTQLMTVIVQDTDPARAALIANTLVQVFSDQIQADQAARYADSKTSLENQLASLEQQIQTTSTDLAALGSGNQNQAEQDQLQLALTQYRQSYASVLQSYGQVKLAEAQSSSGIIQKAPAVPPEKPILPQPLRSGLLAAVVGLFLGAGIVFLIEFLDDSLRDPQEITRKWGIPILGMIITFDTNNGNELITEEQPRSPVSEAFRSLRTNLQFASIASPIHTLLVTSPSPEDGKTIVVGNLACVFAQGGRKVVVLDADLRKPRVHKVFQLQNRLGLTEQFIHPQENLDGAIQPTEVKNLHVLTSGSLPPNPSELLGSQRMVEIVQALKAQYELVLIDTPPALVVTDANVLANRADGVLLVISPILTKRAAIKHAIEQLAQVNANIVGVVLNGVDVKRSRYSYYRGYYYKYGHGYAYYKDAGSGGTGKLKSRQGRPRENPLSRAIGKLRSRTPGGQENPLLTASENPSDELDKNT